MDLDSPRSDDCVTYIARVGNKRVLKTRRRGTIRKQLRRIAGLGGRAPPTAPRVRVGADCAGLNLSTIALELLNVNVDFVFGSEKDPSARSLLKHNFDAAWHDDIMTRRDDHLPQVDLYTAGPPCQAYSSAGLGNGLTDPRGVVFLRVLQTIERAKPAAFILENVKGLVTNHENTYRSMVKFLQRIKDAHGVNTYKVRTRILNSRESGGVPQNRPRVYIVGWMRAMESHPFAWPQPIDPIPLRALLKRDVAAEPHVLNDLARTPRAAVIKGLRALIAKHPAAAANFTFNLDSDATPIVLIDTHSSASRGGGNVYIDWCPCLTRSWCRAGGPWIANLNRRMLTAEMESLQGIPNGRLVRPNGVSLTNYRAMLGNGFTVGVVGRVALKLLQTIGRLPHSWPDAWADGFA